MPSSNSHDPNPGPLFPAAPAPPEAAPAPPEPTPGKRPRKTRARRDADWRFRPVHVWSLKERPPPHFSLAKVAGLVGCNSGPVWVDCITFGRAAHWRWGIRWVIVLEPQVYQIIDVLRARRHRAPLYDDSQKSCPWIEPVPIDAPALEPPAVGAAIQAPSPSPSPVARPCLIERPPLLTPEAIADWAHLPRARVKALIEGGEIPSFEMAGEIRVATPDFDAWVERQRRRGKTDPRS
jgi:hypothetical protein